MECFCKISNDEKSQNKNLTNTADCCIDRQLNFVFFWYLDRVIELKCNIRQAIGAMSARASPIDCLFAF